MQVIRHFEPAAAFGTQPCSAGFLVLKHQNQAAQRLGEPLAGFLWAEGLPCLIALNGGRSYVRPANGGVSPARALQDCYISLCVEIELAFSSPADKFI